MLYVIWPNFSTANTTWTDLSTELFYVPYMNNFVKGDWELSFCTRLKGVGGTTVSQARFLNVTDNVVLGQTTETLNSPTGGQEGTMFLGFWFGQINYPKTFKWQIRVLSGGGTAEVSFTRASAIEHLRG